MQKQVQNEPDLVRLMTKIQEQLAVLDKKVDVLINKSFQRPAEQKPAPQPPSLQLVHAHTPVPSSQRSNDQPRGRQMHPAVCADCKKECEIPFKPSGDRPVYCKECFSRRKSGNTVKPVMEHKPQETLPISTVNIPEPPVKEKKKPVVNKKASEKKKPALAKKKKK